MDDRLCFGLLPLFHAFTALSFAVKEIDSAVKSAENGDGNIPMRLLEVFENVAFIMAKHGNPEMKESSPEEWLDTFDTFSIYSIFPELMDLWRANNESLADIKKKLDQQSGS